MRISRWLVACVGLTLVVASTSVVQAQPGGGRGPRGGRGFGFGGPFGGGGGGQLMLLRNEKVQKELEIVDDQKAEITKLAEDQDKLMREMFASFRDIPEDERQAKIEENRKKMEENAKAVREKVNEILEPRQVARLKEISLQMRGDGALADPEVAKELGLSEDQTKQLAEIRDESFEKSRELFRPGADETEREEMRKKMEELRKETSQKTLAVLSPEQQEKFEKLKGKKTDLDLRTLFGPPGGGRGRRGPGGGGGGGNNPSP